MVKGCGPKTAKFILFAFNIIFFLAGAGILGIGIWLKVDSGSLSGIMNKLAEGTDFTKFDSYAFGVVDTAANILIAAGVIVFVIAFMGCCGAAKQWRPLLISYGVLLIIIMGLEIGVGIYAGVNSNDLDKSLGAELNKIPAKFKYVETTVDNNQAIKLREPKRPDLLNPETVLMNAAHVWFGCCGIDSYRDFLSGKAPYYNRDAPPVYCCKMSDPSKLIVKDRNCGVDENARTNNATSNANLGCYTQAKTFMRNRMDVVIGVAVTFGLVNLVGIICAFWLTHAINKKH